MKQAITILFYLLTLTFSYGKITKRAISDSTEIMFYKKLETIKASYNQDIHFLNAKYKHQIDSLQIVMINFKSRDSFFSDNLSETVSVFSVIVGIIVSLIGLLSFGSIRFYVNKKTKSLEAKYQHYLKLAEKNEIEIYRTSSYANLSLTKNFNLQGNYVDEFLSGLSSVYYNYLYSELIKNFDYPWLVKTLDESKVALEIALKSQTPMLLRAKISKGFAKSYILKLRSCENNEVVKKCVELIDLLNKIEELELQKEN